MRFIARELTPTLRKAAKAFPAVVLTGPRRSGKTYLLRGMYPNAQYFLLEDPSIVARLREDPAGFLDGLQPPVILDEVQNVPEVFAMVRARIDAKPKPHGQWFLTGSQESSLMSGVSESMAGRAAILQLRPLSYRESEKVGVLQGGYPEVLARPKTAGIWFESFLQTYLERDVRSILNVKDLSTFRRFLGLLAARHGQIVNKTDIAAPLGVSIPTIGHWLGVMEATAQILVVPPYFENFGKRLTKSPKLYLADSGLACHLLGITSQAEYAKSPFRGVLFEGFVASEIVKAHVNRGARPQLYFFRDEQGLEVDFVYPGKAGALTLVECKSMRSVTPPMARPMSSFNAAIKARYPDQNTAMQLVHEKSQNLPGTHAIAPGVRAVSWPEFVQSL
jgi:predicted AAA+ superfamily ATPase